MTRSEAPPPRRWDDSAVRQARPAVSARARLDPWKLQGTSDELERTADGRRRVRTLFLTGAECPFACTYCDLWRYTVDGLTPESALPAQIRDGLDGIPQNVTDLKLYNASNFFDGRAVPTADLPEIARLVASFERVIVECHPRLIDERCLDFARRLAPDEPAPDEPAPGETSPHRLELALGLETTHAGALASLNKKMTLEDIRRSTAFALDNGLRVRTFVLHPAPGVPPEEAEAATLATIRFARELGVHQVSIVPLRASEAPIRALVRAGRVAPPTLEGLERTFEKALTLGDASFVVTLDTWDLESVPGPRSCATGACRDTRRRRLEAMNASGGVEPPVSCEHCRS